LTNDEPKLLDFYTKESVAGKKVLDIRARMLYNFPNTVISSQILRASIFFCSRKVWKLLDEYQEKDSDALEVPWHRVVREVGRRSWQKSGSQGATVAFRLLSPESTFIRCNNLSAYVEANRFVLRQ